MALAGLLDAVASFTALHWACESRDPKRVQATLRGVDCTALELASALELVTNRAAFQHEPSPVCAQTAKLVRAALQPWSPAVHHVQTAAFRRAAFTVMCVAMRLQGQAEVGRRRSRRLLLRTQLPSLPLDCWTHVLVCCGRGWWDN